MKKVEFFKHNIDAADIRRVNDVLRSVFLTTGAQVSEFEERFSRYLGSKRAVGVTSCTGALQLCLQAWGVGPGDEVITTPMSFCATANAVIQAGARPVFADVEPGTGNIDARLIESRITRRTRAIVPVHLYGQMCDMRAIRRIAKRHRLAVIEDAAHCIEGERDGVRVGSLSDAACYSFYATKNITCGEGGAISTNNAAKAELLTKFRSHGIDKTASSRYTRKYRHWDMDVFGWKYNMDNIQAALLLGQLGRIDSLLARRQASARRYENGLKGVPGLALLQTAPGVRHSRHLFTILVPPRKRDAMLHALQENGVGVAVNYRPIHLLTYYRRQFGFRAGNFPVAEDIGARTISLPLYPKLQGSEVDFVVDAVIKQARRLRL